MDSLTLNKNLLKLVQNLEDPFFLEVSPISEHPFFLFHECKTNFQHVHYQKLAHGWLPPF
jgi:hypothetical protein